MERGPWSHRAKISPHEASCEIPPKSGVGRPCSLQGVVALGLGCALDHLDSHWKERLLALAARLTLTQGEPVSTHPMDALRMYVRMIARSILKMPAAAQARDCMPNTRETTPRRRCNSAPRLPQSLFQYHPTMNPHPHQGFRLLQQILCPLAGA